MVSGLINVKSPQPQETRIEVRGQSWTGSMYVIGGRDPIPSVTLHTRKLLYTRVSYFTHT